MAPTLKLTYFDMRGRAEPIRHALVAGGIEFEDKRISGPDFMKMKEAGSFPFGSIPVLEIDGEMIAESNAILRYVGKLGGLYPKDMKDACVVDMVMDAVDGLANKIWADKTEEARTKVVKEDFPRYVKPLDDTFAKSDGSFLLGNDISVADIKVFALLSFISEGILDHIPADSLDGFVHLQTAVKAVAKNEKIAKWIAAHKK